MTFCCQEIAALGLVIFFLVIYFFYFIFFKERKSLAFVSSQHNTTIVSRFYQHQYHRLNCCVPPNPSPPTPYSLLAAPFLKFHKTPKHVIILCLKFADDTPHFIITLVDF